MSTRAAIYVRASKDASGTGRSVEQQEAECRSWCEKQGMTVVEVVVDNDLSASKYARKGRPGYERLVDEVLKTVDVVVVWEQSRVTRDEIQWGLFVQECGKHSVGIKLLDRPGLVDPDDVMPKFMAVMNAETSAQTSRRVKRAMKARAKAGKPQGLLPFGYVKTETGWEIDPSAAAEVRDMAARILAGESLYSLGKRYGRPARSIRHMLLSPTYTGIRTHHDVTYTGDWKPILTEDEHRRLVAVLTDPARVNNTGPKPIHLASGIAVCYICKTPVRYARRKSAAPAYRCPAGHTTRKAETVEAAIEAVLFRAFGAEILAHTPTDPDTDKAAAEATELRQLLDAELDAIAEAEVSPTTRARLAERMEAKYLPRIQKLQEKAGAVENPALRRLVDGGDPRAVWQTLTIEEKRSVVRECVTVEIPAIPPKGVDPRTLGTESVMVTLAGRFFPHGFWTTGRRYEEGEFDV
jgi:DNA invertase Pin-like site-specific DNA recombinase